VSFSESIYMALQKLRTSVAVLSAPRLWIDNIDVYLGLCWTMWHCDTSFLLLTVFPYHFISTNARYLYDIHAPSTVYKLRVKSVYKIKTKGTVNGSIRTCVKIVCCFRFICMAYLNMPEMFTGPETDSNYTKWA
jgi:hypothetical protein